eukprot:CAMPEP_0173084538 /NCGR_PEP_ID=MMETSP1102-20130122/20645_1 /TAXON_ID=49646 /ORGANISM="Geminigera sp., Strain Caron Lab Isolate" /LENGTH=76 /DNA_ID=CAMNT_0013962763 /DNA_START=533 /DNA_END=763 /DNA_ORIENTATION=-
MPGSNTGLESERTIELPGSTGLESDRAIIGGWKSAVDCENASCLVGLATAHCAMRAMASSPGRLMLMTGERDEDIA